MQLEAMYRRARDTRIGYIETTPSESTPMDFKLFFFSCEMYRPGFIAARLPGQGIHHINRTPPLTHRELSIYFALPS